MKPAVEWVLDKYEKKLDLATGTGKREFSDVAMRVISYLKDPVERKHYEQMVAKRLDVSVEDLVAKKMDFGARPRRLKAVKTDGSEDTNKALKGLEDNLLAIMLYGGEAGAKVNLEIPEDEARVAELELVYEKRYKKWGQEALVEEVKGLLKRREEEVRKAKMAELTAKLEEASEEEEREIMREINKLNKARK